MKLRVQTVYSKALAIFVALSLLLGGGVIYLTQAIIAREFRETEFREVEASVGRLKMMLARELTGVELLLAELSAQGGIDPLSLPLDPVRLDFVGLLAPGGEFVVWESVKDLSPATRRAIQVLAPQIVEQIRSETHTKSSTFLMANEALIALAWMPSENPSSHGELLIGGSLIFGPTLEFLESIVVGKITFQSLVGEVIGPPGTEPLVAMLSGKDVVVEEQGADAITGMTLLQGLNGSYLGIMKLTQGRPLEQSGARAVNIFLTVLVLAGGLLFAAIWFVLDRTILARIRQLTQEVHACQTRGQLPVQLNFDGGDELGQLARQIEELALLLEKVQFQYRAVVEDQTEVICRFDEQFSITFANDVFWRLFWEGPEPPASIQEILPRDCMDFLAKRFRRLYATAPIDTFLHQVVLRSGEKLWFRSTLRRSFAPDGTGIGGQWVAAEVTAQVLAEQGIQQSERQMRALSARLMSLQDEERRRIARELHDSTAQSLSALEMNVSLLDPLATDARTRRIVKETREIARHCCQELRNISYLLHPPLLDEVGLPFAIRWFTDGFTTRTGIPIDLELPEDFPRLAADVETALFRVVQEATSNIYRHSGASGASITLTFDGDGSLEFTISDNGKGFADTTQNGEPPNPGIGLAGMRERLAHIGGSFSVQTAPSGVTIRISIPTKSLYAASK